MLKVLFLLINAVELVTAVSGSPGLNANVMTVTEVTGSWATSYPSSSASDQAVSTGSWATSDPNSSAQAVSTAPASAPEDDDPGRLWVTYRRFIDFDDPDFRYVCFYDIFESRKSVDPFNVCLHPYNASWAIGRDLACAAGYRMAIPEFSIGFEPLGVSKNCAYHPEDQSVHCDSGIYPCLIVNQANDWVQCPADNPEKTMSNYGAYARLQCDGFPTKS
ncbi:hypothetical protein QBC40DRAFT_231633 [Triangularia verruculosa]|uniref:Uncharacterized protein n=1 Tax=Triangularia verruculosa TaxID=2587418 RepID=A0AAN6XBT5_9PEZI|nr:hypothetical protein QBC40DRAFT_231633 [Triangularia verruculosa]